MRTTHQLLAWLILPTFAGLAAAADKPINLLFIMTDQHHFQAMGCAGNTVVKTPNLDRLAGGGTRFTSSFCVVPYCSPTRAALVTGRFPSTIGLGIGRNILIGPNAGRDPLRLHDPVDTYMQHLTVMGYHCHQLGKWHLGEPSQLSCFPEARADIDTPQEMFEDRLKAAGAAAFDADPRPGEVEKFADHTNHQDVWMPAVIAEACHKLHEDSKNTKDVMGKMGRAVTKPGFFPEAALADHCINLMKRHKEAGEPFAITFSLSPPHEPFVAPAPYYDMYDPAKLPLPTTWNDQPSQWAKTGAARTGEIYAEAGFREYLRCYYARVTMADAWIGRVLDALDQLGLADHTLVVFTSDHGNLIGEHHMMEKSTGAFYDPLARVPLIMRLPGRIPAGKTCDATASSVDVPMTILDYTGGAPLPTAQGRSLRPFIDGAADDDRPAFGERQEPQSPTAARMIRTRQWKFCLHPKGLRELFDLTRDPNETHNLASDPAMKPTIEKLTAQLLDHMRTIGDPAIEHFN